MFAGGYHGNILRVNLTDKTTREESLSEPVAQQFIGGAGFGIKYLFDEVKPQTDPLGHGNKLIFALGPLTGTTIPCSSRMAVCGKSPLTQAVGMSLSGGHFPVECKRTGYDAIIIEGRAKNPVYIVINNKDVRIRSAGKLWGTKTFDCQQIIKDTNHDQHMRVACIGPAGENLSLMASIINERRAFGRKGLGAVMGSKNLKAIAVRGNTSVSVADEKGYKKARNDMTRAMKESPTLYRNFGKYGTTMVIDGTCALGILPAKNWTATGSFEPHERIGAHAQSSRDIGKEPCHGCPVGCSHLKIARTPPYEGVMSEGPEFETLYSLGSQTGVDNLDSIIAADRLCDELGIDTISTGVVIGFAMELFEKGILSKEDTDGIDLRFGNHEEMCQMVQKLAFRDGIGDLLADGVKKAAERIGKDAQRFALHVKGLELPGYDVRGAKAQGLNYATAYTGADHCRGYAAQEIFGVPLPYPVDRFSTENKGRLTKWNQDIRTAICDCPLICSFVFGSLHAVASDLFARMLTAVTGLRYMPEEIAQVGERIYNLARAFNVREGFTRRDDTLPERILTEPLTAGASKGHFISRQELDHMLDEYYQARGWDQHTGIPTTEKLRELGLEYIIKTLHP